MWLAALTGRLAFVAHALSGHAVAWKMPSDVSSVSPGDVVCYECGEVLWCRARDPWRASTAVPTQDPSDAGDGPASLFDNLQQVLRLAEACPPGSSGNAIRRAACELVEAGSAGDRTATRRRMLRCVVRVQQHAPPRADDPSPVLLRQLADALRGERWVRERLHPRR